MTTTIRKIKGSEKFALCQWIDAELKPIVVSGDYNFLVSFCKHQNYTWYFNLSDDCAIAV